MTDPKPSTLPLGHEFQGCSLSCDEGCPLAGKCHLMDRDWESCGRPRAAHAEQLVDNLPQRGAAHDAPPTPVPAWLGHEFKPGKYGFDECQHEDSFGRVCYKPEAAHIEPAAPLPQPEPVKDPLRTRPDYDLRCQDCGAPHNVDTSIPSPVWNAICENRAGILPGAAGIGMPEVGVLCTLCIEDRLKRAGLTCDVAEFYFTGENLSSRMYAESTGEIQALQREIAELRSAPLPQERETGVPFAEWPAHQEAEIAAMHKGHPPFAVPPAPSKPESETERLYALIVEAGDLPTWGPLVDALLAAARKDALASGERRGIQIAASLLEAEAKGPLHKGTVGAKVLNKASVAIFLRADAALRDSR